MMKPNFAAKLAKMAAIIREKKAIPFGELCLIMNMAPATMYGYITLMKNVFLDIRYENGVFECTRLEMFEKSTNQRRLDE